MKKIETYEEQVDRLVAEIKANGQIHNDRYLLTTGPSCGGDDLGDQWTVRVFNKQSGMAEAFSSMRADFEPSLREFVEDYFL